MTVTRWLVSTMLLAAMIAALAATPADAQIGGLKNAAKRAVQGAGSGGPAKPDSSVVEITPHLLDRLETILDIESEMRDADAKRAAVRQAEEDRRQEHESCTQRFRSGRQSEFESLAQRMKQAQGRGDMRAITALSDTARLMQQRMLSDEAKSCGPAPATGVEAQRADQLEQRRRAALDAAGLSPRQFAIVKERIVPFCAMAQRGAGSSQLRVPGIGRGNSYIYTDREAAAIAPRCATLAPRLQATP